MKVTSLGVEQSLGVTGWGGGELRNGGQQGEQGEEPGGRS